LVDIYFDRGGTDLGWRDSVRIVEHDDSLLVICCNGSRASFERWSGTVSRTILDRCEAFATNRRTRPSTRDLMDVSRAALIDFGEPEACAWVTVLAVEERICRVMWASGDEVWSIDDDRAERRTVGQWVGPNAPGILSNGIGDGYSGKMAEHADWDVSPSTVIIVASGTLADRLSPDLVARVAHGRGSDALEVSSSRGAAYLVRIAGYGDRRVRVSSIP